MPTLPTPKKTNRALEAAARALATTLYVLRNPADAEMLIRQRAAQIGVPANALKDRIASLHRSLGMAYTGVPTARDATVYLPSLRGLPMSELRVLLHEVAHVLQDLKRAGPSTGRPAEQLAREVGAWAPQVARGAPERVRAIAEIVRPLASYFWSGNRTAEQALLEARKALLLAGRGRAISNTANALNEIARTPITREMLERAREIVRLLRTKGMVTTGPRDLATLAGTAIPAAWRILLGIDRR